MTPTEITNKMMQTDAFSQWLGIQVLEVGEGNCVLKMKVRPEMVNGFLIAHGGITYSLADSCLAFASNSFGRVAVSVETSVSHMQSVRINDELTAHGTCIQKSYKLGVFLIDIFNQDKELVAHFKGTTYFKSEIHNG